MTPPGHADLSVPLILGISALVLVLTLQTVQLVRERVVITEALAGQTALILDADRVRRQLDGLLAGVNTLAGQGNGTARAVLDDLRRQGIVYSPPSPNS